MKKISERKTMTLGKLTMYLGDLIKMGLVSEQIDSNGKQHYKLTELGKKSGLKGLSK